MKEKSFSLDFQGASYPVHYIKDPSNIETALKHLMAKDCLFAIDTETAAKPEFKGHPKAGLSPHLSDVRLIQVFDGTNVCVFDLQGITPSTTSALFVPFLSSKRFIAHFATFDLMYFMQMGVQDMNLGCTHILLKLLYHAYYAEDAGLGASLEAACKKFLGFDMLKANQASDWSEPEVTFEQIEYAATDTIALMKLAEKLAPGLSKFGLERIYKLTKDAQHAICRMQLNGIELDIESHRALIPKWTEKLVKAKREVEKLTGIKTLTAPKIGLWLEENLDAETLAIWPRTESGKLGTDANTFVDFGHLDIVAPFSMYQKQAILCSTFGDKLINQVNPATGRLHANYKLLGARTGRLSCSDPNLQNLPRDTEVRNNFRAKEGCVFLCADYSQIELRIAAEISQDRQMLRAYNEGTDLHALTASRVLNKPILKVSKTDRQIGKALGLGLLYGLGARKFTHYIKKGYSKDGVSVTEQQSEDLIDAYRETYSGFRAWQIKQAEQCKVSLKARTPCGKIRKLNEENYYGGGLNVPIQGAAAEVMLYALVKLEKAFRGIGLLVNCVHDEVLIEIPVLKKRRLEHLKALMVECMTEAYLEVFPNGITRDLVEAKVGNTWASAK